MRKLLLAAVLVLGLAATPASGASTKDCGSFPSGSYTIEVSATATTCKKARAIQKEYWNGPDSRKIVRNGGSGYAGYILLKRYPGWKCTSGSGGGGCRKGAASASYQN